MQEISITTKNLPQTIEEKTAYVLFGSDALNAYRKKLKAIQEKFGISSEQYKQIQLEAQETAENLLLFSMDIGNEMEKIEQTKGNRYSLPSASGSTKQQAIHNMGFTDRQARDFQTLAKHPEVVKQAIQDAKDNDRIVTRQDVLNRIAPPQSHQQTLRAVEKQVRAEHQAFKEKKKDSVVSFQDIEKDRKNEQFIINRTDCDLKRVIGAVGDINFLNVEDIDALVKSLDKDQKEWYIRNLREAVNILIHIMKKMEV